MLTPKECAREYARVHAIMRGDDNLNQPYKEGLKIFSKMDPELMTGSIKPFSNLVIKPLVKWKIENER